MANNVNPEFARRSGGRSVLPVKELPKIPDAIKKDPRYKEAWEEWERSMDEWRKSLSIINTSDGRTIVTSETITNIIQGTPGLPGKDGKDGKDGEGTTIVTGEGLSISIQTTDPGALGAGAIWIDTAKGTANWCLYVRNTNNSAWELLAGWNEASAFRIKNGVPQFYNPDTGKYHAFYAKFISGEVTGVWGDGED